MKGGNQQAFVIIFTNNIRNSKLRESGGRKAKGLPSPCGIRTARLPKIYHSTSLASLAYTRLVLLDLINCCSRKAGRNVFFDAESQRCSTLKPSGFPET